jgi:hypothetical protein
MDLIAIIGRSVVGGRWQQRQIGRRLEVRASRSIHPPPLGYIRAAVVRALICRLLQACDRYTCIWRLRRLFTAATDRYVLKASQTRPF